MLYRPSNMIPSSFAGEGMDVIDATVDNIFSATINGTMPVVAYRLIIYENTTENSITYDTGAVQLDAPFYGSSYNQAVIPFTVTVPASSGMVNGFASGYKWTLTLWWAYSASSPDTGCVTSTEQFVLTRSTPSVVINPFESPITTKAGSWSAVYTSAENVPIMWFEWQVASVGDDGYTVVASTGRIYQAAELKYVFDGLSNGENYSIKLTVHNQDGIEVDSGWNDFTVMYTVINVEDVAAVTVLPVHGIKVDWGKVQFIEGVSDNGNYKIYDSSEFDDAGVGWWGGTDDRKVLYIAPEERIVFTSSPVFDLDIAKPSTHVWQGAVRVDGQIREWATTDGSDVWTLDHEGMLNGLIPYDKDTDNRLIPSETLPPQDCNGGHFEFTITEIEDGVTTTRVYRYYTDKPGMHWYTVIMRDSGLTVYEFDMPASAWAFASQVGE